MISKVLLAHLPERDRSAYLANGPFLAVTAKTICDPAEYVRQELEPVRLQGIAGDNEEMAEGLVCLAVLIAGRCG